MFLYHNLLFRCNCRVGIELPTVEVRFRDLSVEAECEVVHGKPIPTLWNTVKGILSVSNIKCVCYIDLEVEGCCRFHVLYGRLFLCVANSKTLDGCFTGVHLFKERNQDKHLKRLERYRKAWKVNLFKRQFHNNLCCKE